ncbi:uncharacterized protein LOC121008747 [Bufo bufo]|uniref:uncharacterized protein LOC121008747 n=1 Tax=Bufo bufo TaxID=8384 RepID=UPI001ABE1D05|nr:uncharacterized protein LOC121008747 [Bufo bufo]
MAAHNIHLQKAGGRERLAMDCKVPSSDIIPAVAARLKYYVAIERKEAGFDLSVNQQDSDGKHRLYQVPATSDNVDYEIAVHTTARFQEETTPSMFIRLYGESGRTKTLSLQNPLAATITSSADRAFTFYVKTKDVGELTDLSMGINTKDKACIWYCIKVIVKKGTQKYIFPYNNWFSSYTKNCQTKKDKCRPTTSKPQSSKNISCLVSSKKVEFPITHDGKLETSKKESDKDLDSWKINNKKSIQSPRTAEGNTSKTRTLITRYGSSERRPQGIPSSKKATFQASSGKTRTSKDTSDQVTLMTEKHSTTIMSDGSKAQPLLGEDTMYNITSSNTSTKRDLTIQSNIQPPKYRRASSPASYVFFALENKESSTIDQVNECTKRYLQDGSSGPKLRIRRRAFSEMTNIESQRSGEGKNYISFNRTSSQLALLQELLSNSVNNVTSGSLDSQPFSSRENSEETRAQCGADDEVHGDHTHKNDYDKLCSQLDCAAAKTSGYTCSCGEHSGYETDSTLDEEFIFSDTSLDLSLSDDDDSDSSSKFDVLGNCPEYNNEEDNLDVMEKSKHQIHRQRRVESCSENSSVFQRSLAAINNGDDRTLRILCQSHFFLPSVTDEEGKTLLHHAAEQDNPSICQVLLDTNIGLVNMDQRDTFGKTALHYAGKKGNPKTIKTLMDNGANLEI